MLQSESSAANASIHVLLRSIDRFHAAHNRYPGAFDTKEQVEEDVALLKGIATTLITEWGLKECSIHEDMMVEMVRCAGTQLHTVSSIIGGIAAQ
eukprot:15317590-Ditylum_brightwellii.AAC.1